MSTDDGEHGYDIHLDDKYGALARIDIPAEIAANEPWFNQTRAPQRTAMLMVEAAGVVPTGD